MGLVLVAGAASHGSTRWIDIGFFTFQPSEFGKVLFVLALAGVLADRCGPGHVGAGAGARPHVRPAGRSRSCSSSPTSVRRWSTRPRSAACCSSPAYVGFTWPCSFVVAVVALCMILWILPAAGVNVLKPYQTARLTGFTHPSNDPRGATYNLRQSITAVGAGGLRGRGVLGATQTRLNYLPAHSTDFAFASLAEEHGFFGAAILLLLYLLVVWRALKVVTVATDLYSAIVAGAIAFMFLFQVFVNSAMTMGIAPITGIPLPFVSVGGSSMLTNFLALGVLQAIYLRRSDRRRA